MIELITILISIAVAGVLVSPLGGAEQERLRLTCSATFMGS